MSWETFDRWERRLWYAVSGTFMVVWLIDVVAGWG